MNPGMNRIPASWDRSEFWDESWDSFILVTYHKSYSVRYSTSALRVLHFALVNTTNLLDRRRAHGEDMKKLGPFGVLPNKMGWARCRSLLPG